MPQIHQHRRVNHSQPLHCARLGPARAKGGTHFLRAQTGTSPVTGRDSKQGGKSVDCHAFNIGWARSCPDKTDAELIIEADAVLTFAMTAQRFQLIAWRRTQFPQLSCCVQLIQLTPRCRLIARDIG